MKGDWVTPFAWAQMKHGNVWHEDFGWLPAAHVSRYENGERYFQNHWYDAKKEKEAKLEKAQDDLRKVLSLRQEAAAVLAGLLNPSGLSRVAGSMPKA